MADVSIAALMTAPRHEITWVRTQIHAALSGYGIPLTVSGGVFYGQCMQRMLEDVVSQGVDYALTIDFDSVFTQKHVERLLGIIVHRPEIDALCAIQPKRGNGAVLGSNRLHQEIEWTGQPIRLQSGHFGLTLIDLHRLKGMPKPWFCSTPDDDGGWEGNKVDDDVFFWNQWAAYGRSLYCDPGCRLGHYEELVTVFDPEMQVQHYYPSQWTETQHACAVD